MFEPLLLVRSGGVWEAMPVTAPSDPTSVVLTGVSCPRRGTCFAYGTAGGRATLFFPAGDGWRGVYFAAPPGVDQQSIAITSIACSGPGNCVALGTYEGSDASSRLVAETLRRGQLSAVPIDAPALGTDPTTRTGSVDCAAGGTCAAVAGYDSGTRALLLVRSAGSWRTDVADVPGGVPAGADRFLNGVSCSSATVCTAVGGYVRTHRGGQAIDRPLAQTWTGGQWQPLGMSRPMGVDGIVADRLFQVSCADSRCLAVGTFERYTANGAVGYSGAIHARAVRVPS